MWRTVAYNYHLILQTLNKLTDVAILQAYANQSTKTGPILCKFKPTGVTSGSSGILGES